MKRITLLPIIALLASVVSLVMTLNDRDQNRQALEAATHQALVSLEKQHVNSFRDRYYILYSGQELGVSERWDPQNIDDLLSPLFRMINSVEE